MMPRPFGGLLKMLHTLSSRNFRRVIVPALVLSSAFFMGDNFGAWLSAEQDFYRSAFAANSDHTTDRLLKAVVPGAESFSDKQGEPPVYRAFKTDPETGEQSLIAYAFVTPDFPPEPNGYSGPIDTLIGMDLDGKIVGLKVIYYKESLRYTIGDFFSWGFEEQFVGLDAANRFRVDKEIDGIVKATISAKAAARGIRRSVRAVTEAYIN
jgi:transcriptional regulator of nitric oxide reductase